MESEFNLIYEPWIKVRNVERVSEVSLLEVLANAHKYTSLAGEMPTQDLAILRLLLAVLHSALYDTEVDYEEEDDIPINKWEFLWNNGCFPKDTITAYLERFKDRFWLFDDKHPFYQVADIEEYTPLAAAKLNGALLESGNKIRLFPMVSGSEKESLSYSEAARWLVCLNAWDDGACKKAVDKGKEWYENGQKIGWLGSLGNIYAIGDNLFETLMLNLVFDSPDTKQHPVWERELSCNTTVGKMYGTVTPDNQAELLTLLGRYILLKRGRDENEKKVIDVWMSKKSLVPQSDLFAEKMTVWAKNKENRFYPKNHDPSIQIWREFSSIVPKSDNDNQRPGIREWICNFVEDEQPLHDRVISFGMCGVEYSKDSTKGSIVNSFGDSLTLHAALLSELGKEWDELISNEISECDKIAAWCEKMQKILILSKSPVPDKLDKINAQAKVVREKFYSLIDLSLRKWIESIDPQTDNPFDKRDEIRKTVSDIAKKYAAELAENAGAGAIIGRHGNDIFSKSKDAKRHYSSPEALNYFYGRIAKYMKGVDVGAK